MQGHNWNECEQARWSEPGYFSFRDRASGESLSADAAYARFQAEEASVKHLGKRVNVKASELSYLLTKCISRCCTLHTHETGRRGHRHEPLCKRINVKALLQNPKSVSAYSVVSGPFMCCVYASHGSGSRSALKQ